MAFSIEVYNLNTTNGAYTKIDEIGNFLNAQFYNIVGGVGVAKFRIAGNSAKALLANFVRYKTTYVIREGSVIRWVGEIHDLTFERQDADYWWTVDAFSVLKKLEGRYTPRFVEYKNTAQGEILWQLLLATQMKTNGHLGISQGTTEGFIRDRSYEFINLKDAFVNMSKVINGCEFYFDATTNAQGLFTGYTLNTRLPSSTYRTNLPPINIGLGSNVIRYTAKPLGDVTNSVTVKGAGTGDEYLTAAAVDEASGTAFGLRESVVSKNDVQELPTLQDWADGIVETDRFSTYIIELEMVTDSNLNPDAFFEGDILNITVDKFVGQCTVLSKEFSVSPEGILEWGMKVKFVFI
jgi:hypothetical protein